jgi:TRAP-type mannitol/chloroaromatic compound transport system permease small subunit
MGEGHMEALIKISNALDAAINWIARVAAWAGVLLISVTIFDVVTRRFLVLGSTKLQEAEWHLHTILFVLLLGCAYLRDSHVRIDLIRERLSERAQWWIELLGCLFFLLPFCALVVYFSVDFTVRSYETHEISSSATGLSHRWIIKSFIPIGFTVLGLAGVTVLLRKLVELFGPSELRHRAHEIEEAEEAHLVDRFGRRIERESGD